MINIDNISIKIAGEYIFKNIKLKINDGDYIALIGENGSGKTTLIKSILGLNDLSEGELYIDNVNIKDFSQWDEIGYVPQQSNINHDIPITVGEYLNLYTKNKEKINLLMNEFDIKKFSKTQYRNLSGGQKQRVDIVKSLLNDIKYLILDEPNTGLDKEKRNDLYKTLHNINDKGITIIIITHNLEEIKDKIHKIYDLKNKTLTEMRENDCSHC